LGVALGAESVAIYSDVDGVMTADPRIVPNAQVIEILRADEMYQMAKMGSKIVHLDAAELALRGGVNLLVKNTYTAHSGSRIVDMTCHQPSTAISSVVSSTDVVRFVVSLEAEEGSESHLAAQTGIYERLAAAGVSLDMFTPAGSCLYFTVTCSCIERAEQALADLSLAYSLRESLAKVTVVGAGMHGVPGVMARIASALNARGIDILQVADSNTTISVLLTAEHEAAAVCALHDAFELDKTSTQNGALV
jgi:aspartate kinase